MSHTPKTSDELLRLMGEPELCADLGISLDELRCLTPLNRFDLQTRAAQVAAQCFLERSKLPDDVYLFARRGPRTPPAEVKQWVEAKARVEVTFLKLEGQTAAIPVWIHCFFQALQGLCRPPPGM